MTGVGMDHLAGLYAETDDPWGFAHSPYEQTKFRATIAALPRHRYSAVFELGCGNGQLARHLIDVTEHYTGLDAVDRALDAARRTIPDGRFIAGYYPCPLPDDAFDLIVLSEILYYLDDDGICRLARQIADRWPLADVICVSWLGPSGHRVQGNTAVTIFIAALKTHRFARVSSQCNRYRIDVGQPDAQR